MTKHKTEYYKNSAVKHYLNNYKGDGYNRTCKIIDCKKSTLRKSPHLQEKHIRTMHVGKGANR